MSVHSFDSVGEFLEPASHSYLGKNLETIKHTLNESLSQLNSQNECDIPLLTYPGVIIFPRETIPLRLPKQLWTDLHSLSNQQGHFQGNDTLPYNYFGLVNKRHHYNRNGHVSLSDQKFSKIINISIRI